MEQSNGNEFLSCIKHVLCARELKVISRRSRFEHRRRKITGERLVLSLLSLFSSGRVSSLSDIHRSFNAQCDTNVSYKPFHNQLSKKQFPELMREVASRCLTHLVVKIFSRQQQVFSEFKQVLIHDGSSFAIKDDLKEVYPGRFTKIKPAAVELHTTFDLMEQAPTQVTLTPDTTSERAVLPEAESLSGCLLLIDRGYFALPYLSELVAHKASFLVRGKSDCNPEIITAHTSSGKRLKKMEGKPLRKTSRLRKSEALDCCVCWKRGGYNLKARMIITWNPKTKCFFYLVTNLDTRKYSVQDVLRIYKLRWQGELLFKEWKSYANLHAFDTQNPYIAEGLIWTSIAAATITRFFANATAVSQLAQVSQLKTAKVAPHFIPKFFQALRNNHTTKIQHAWIYALRFLSSNALRAHPIRDREKGRLTFGLDYAFAH